MSQHATTDPPQPDDFRTVREFIEAARQHHARTGEWPPDPLLDEVAEMRRQILAEHDNDYNKVLDWYVELGREHASRNGHPQEPAAENQSVGPGGR